MLQKIRMQTGGAKAQAEALKQKILNARDIETFSGKVYYVSQNGDDKNDGLSPERAIKTHARVGKLSLEAGDAVLFERGSVFRATD